MEVVGVDLASHLVGNAGQVVPEVTGRGLDAVVVLQSLLVDFAELEDDFLEIGELAGRGEDGVGGDLLDSLHFPKHGERGT